MNLKILITVSSITPGSGLSKYILSLATILNKLNYQVIVATTHDNNVGYEQKILTTCGNVTFVSFGHLNKINKYLQVLQYIRQQKPNIIINNYNAVIQYLLPFISRKTKIIHIIHSTTKEFYRIATINAKYVDGWVVPTTAMKSDLCIYSQNKYKNKIHVIPHGVESPLQQSIAQSLTKELVFVGVLYDHKGVLILPDIIHQLILKKEKFHFTIIGNGKEKGFLETHLKDELTKGIVTMTGVITSEEVYQYLSKADIFVYPTHIDSFGLVIAEAMINGTAPIVTHLKGITDNLIDNGKNGYLLKQDDIQSFVEHITLLLHNEELLTSLKLAAKKKAESCFSFETMKRNYQEYLESL